ncbi:MAG: hypothetical protein H0V87_01670 [Chloroflexi bacterium]|nr:hypothetical protein [Chloroflexota bacterium]
MAPKSVELLHTILRGALATAAQRGHIIRNVAALVSPPLVPKRKQQVFTIGEIGRMLGVGDRLTGTVDGHLPGADPGG